MTRARTTGLLAAGVLFVTLSPVDATAQDRGDRGFEPRPGALQLESSHQLQPAVVDGQKMVSVIIELDTDPVASYDGDVAGLPATSPEVTGDGRLDTDAGAVQQYTNFVEDRNRDFAARLEATVPGARVTQTYELIIGGVAALVPRDHVGVIGNIDGVEAVHLDELHQLDTAEPPYFIGAAQLWYHQGGPSSRGEDTIVGVIDSGIWPEHPSVADPDPLGHSYPAPPPYWNGSGSGDGCDFGNTAANPDDAPFACNNKLIGAYDFTDTYKAVVGLTPTEFDSARDSNGHGTHTLTTAAGNKQVHASIYGIDRGKVSGVAPRAHVVAYKGCGLQGCFASDTAASIQQAVADGVDVINYSISGGSSPYSDIVSLAMLDAYNAGTLVVPAAGNDGPGADTVSHREPWSLTVGASTPDRAFTSTVDLVADRGATLQLHGASVTPGIRSSTPVVFAPGGAGDLCLTPFPPGTFDGEIVICQRGAISRVAKSYNVAAGGAGGMLLYNPTPEGVATDNHFVPTVHLEADEGARLIAFVEGNARVSGTFTTGKRTHVQGDVIAPFSARGGPGQTLGVSKPDVVAPGVQILAGMTPLPEDVNGGFPGQLFQSIQGTSMSAPHATGSAALIRGVNPDWTPGQIKSALMLTARWQQVTVPADPLADGNGGTPANWFDMGSGRIDPHLAAEVELTMDAPGEDFLTLQDDLWEANTPSIYVPEFGGRLVVERTFANDGSQPGSWKLQARTPSDLIVRVPETLEVPANGSADLRIALVGRDIPEGETRQGVIELTKVNEPLKGQVIHLPVTVVKRQGQVTLDKVCAPAVIREGRATTCTITATNESLDDQVVKVRDRVPFKLKLDRSSVTGAEAGFRVVRFDGTLAGGTPPTPTATVDPLASPGGYFPLAGVPGTVVVDATDESISNFTLQPPGATFQYGGQSYDRVGIVSNGYVVVGGGTAADVDFVNTDFPDPDPPNNVLAPFWTDLNPDAGGRVLTNVLVAGSDAWLVVEWENVPNFGDGETNTAQVWIALSGNADPDDISFTYGTDVSDGAGGFLTVGAENVFGNAGNAVYYDGAGVPPSPSFPNAEPGYEVDVSTVAGTPGETHVIEFDAEGRKVGSWTNYARLRGPDLVGTTIVGFSGTVTAR